MASYRRYCVSTFLASITIFGCTNESNQDISAQKVVETADASPDSGPVGACAPVTAAARLPARREAQTDAPVSTERAVYVDDVFNSFANYCGGCHVDVGLGGFQTTRANFSDVVNQDWVDSIGYNKVSTVMPTPSVGGKLPADRSPDDPVIELQKLLQAWVDSGRPRDSFTMPIDPGAQSGPYRLSPDIAGALTNIGNCLPDTSLYASDKAKMAEMDAKFAAMTFTAPGKGTRAQQIGLPLYLSDTDLVTFDSSELAKTGVIAFAVSYPQWIDPDASVLRHVRVPQGQSISFDKTSQQFVIPGDTRFYKTILQRVTNADGQDRWRKVETQLIISWPNLENAVSFAAVSSLFGTYAWNDDESQATLVTDPYRDGTPFRDHIVTYISDEQKAAATLANKPGNTAYALRKVHALRSFAIPGSRRCAQCHMGSPSKSFVLGFQPLQVVRRKNGESGVIDPVGDDEINQLSRFIDYGLVTGISSPDDVLPLEKSQGSRTPRNNYELVAQGYLFGNCAHCHNPAGDPSLENPSLKPLLDFMPSSTGGIFQFPIDRTSPRITRAGGGTETSVPIPYITPSLMDLGPTDTWTDTFWKPKCNVSYPPPDQMRPMPAVILPVMAPWRSLIYRGVDTPFTYSDDLALVPHMPMHTQSFDCRAPRIVGDWMVSIPAASTSADGLDYGYSEEDPYCVATDSSPQPYREVKKGVLGYQSANANVDGRLDKYHNSPSVPVTNFVLPTNENPNPTQPPMPSRYNYCPENYDIFDPSVLQDPVNQPVPADSRQYQNGQLAMPQDNVPDHAHWVIFDPTLVPGDWAPRRPDWSQILVSNIFPPITGLTGGLYASALDAQNAEKLVVELLQTATLSPAIRRLAQTAIPMGLWQAKSGCDFSAIPTVSSYATSPGGQSKPVYPAAWMQAMSDANQLNGKEPVYAVTPGEALHNMICVNCHGAKANSAGRQATILSEMTGGRANVTDLIDGIMSPSNRQPIFASAPRTNATLDDWAARYFTWMALGGTQQKIPSSILAIVANTRVMGQPRPGASPAKDANMLSSAFHLCASVLPAYLDANNFNTTSFPVQSDQNKFNFEGGMFELDSKSAAHAQTSLIYANGDVLLWEQVCSLDNPPPVRAFEVDWSSTNLKSMVVKFYSFYPANGYPPNAPVGDHRGNVVNGISDGNYFPWCIRPPVSSADRAKANNWFSNGQPVPICPDTANGVPYVTGGGIGGGDQHLDFDRLNRWALRGAINAGFLIFAYFQQMQSGDLLPTPSYDQCEQLTQ